MKDDDLITMWNAIEVPEVTRTELLEMKRVQNQPVLKRIRRQLIFEASGFCLLIVLYYLCFANRGDDVDAGLLLITGLCLYLIQEVLVYRFFNRPQKGRSIPDTLRVYHSRLKVMTIVTIILQGLAACFVLFFLSFAIKMGDVRFWVLRGSALVLAGQWFMVARVWVIKLRKALGKALDYHPLNFLLGENDGPSQGVDRFSRK